MYIFHFYVWALTFLSLFLYGFFPIHSLQSENEIELPKKLFDFDLDFEEYERSEVDRFVLVLIDALRIDFVGGKNTPFLVKTFKEKGCFLKTKVESPTVTLPRIKALTTGSVPQFADVVLNLAGGGEVLNDSVLHRIKGKGKTIVFYGDDTWVKLFPGVFTRYEGVSSFFVNDYTEVDENITRNVVKELENNDWDVMVLHYLGLDHIGHVFGPSSELIGPKLREMDKIIEDIFLKSRNWGKTVLAVTGDHGMKDSGGHGGASYSETYVPFILLGADCKNDSAAQVDIPATLAAMFGVKFPRNNIGWIISNLLLPKAHNERLLYSLHYNARFLLTKTNGFQEDLLHKAYLLHHDFLKTKNSSLIAEIQTLYNQYGRKASHKLVESSVNQNLLFMVSSTTALSGIFFKVIYQFQKKTLKEKPTFFTIFGSVMHTISLSSSSFIEEEHQTWYFFFSTFVLLTLIQRRSLGILLILASIRLLRTLNQTGDKWAHLPDLSDFLLLEENSHYLFGLIFLALFMTLACFSFLVTNKYSLILNTTVLFLVFLFHVFKMTIFVKLIWLFILVHIFLGFRSNQPEKYYLITWVSFCLPLMRSYNIILVPFFMLTSIILKKNLKNSSNLIFIHIWLGHMYFFAQGHSNSLASVDVASGYAGLEEYVPQVVMLQVLCHTYIFPVLANLLLMTNKSLSRQLISDTNILCRIPVLTFTCILILIQRHHLFVWTVFAPKLLIESCYSIVLFLQIVLCYLLLFVHTKCRKLFQASNNKRELFC